MLENGNFIIAEWEHMISAYLCNFWNLYIDCNSNNLKRKLNRNLLFTVVLNMIVYHLLVVSIVTNITLFISGQWNDLQG